MNATHSKALAAAAALLAVPVLSSCGVSFGAQTDQVYTPADGMSDRSGMVDALNVLILSDTPGTGRLIGGLANNDTENDDAVTQIAGASDSEGVEFDVPSDIEIKAGELVQLADGPEVLVTGDPELVAPGKFVRLTITFQNADPVTLNVPVLTPGETYSGVEIPDASSSASPSESPTGQPSESATPAEPKAKSKSPSPKG